MDPRFENTHTHTRGRCIIDCMFMYQCTVTQQCGGGGGGCCVCVVIVVVVVVVVVVFVVVNLLGCSVVAVPTGY